MMKVKFYPLLNHTEPHIFIMEYKQNFSDILATMPPLRHTVGEVFDIDKSEVVAWLMSKVNEPCFRDWLFFRARDSGRIKFNQETLRWVGSPAKPRAPKEPAIEKEAVLRAPSRHRMLFQAVVEAVEAAGGQNFKTSDVAAIVYRDAINENTAVSRAKISGCLAKLREGGVIQTIVPRCGQSPAVYRRVTLNEFPELPPD